MKLRHLITLSAAMIITLVSARPASAQLPNPTDKRVAEARAAGFCSDPWVTIAIWTANGNTANPAGVGNWGECNIQLYNGGSWGSFSELVGHVQATMSAFNNQGVRLSASKSGGNVNIVLDWGGGFVERIVATGGGNLVSHDGGSIVATGGGNFRLQSAGQKSITLPGGRVVVVNK